MTSPPPTKKFPIRREISLVYIVAQKCCALANNVVYFVGMSRRHAMATLHVREYNLQIEIPIYKTEIWVVKNKLFGLMYLECIIYFTYLKGKLRWFGVNGLERIYSGNYCFSTLFIGHHKIYFFRAIFGLPRADIFVVLRVFKTTTFKWCWTVEAKTIPFVVDFI